MTQEAIARRAAKDITKGYDIQLRIEMAIKEALAQEQEPEWYHGVDEHGCNHFYHKTELRPSEFSTPLYTTPPQRTGQQPFEDLAAELFVVAQISPADDGFSETIERIESWLREHFTNPPQRTEPVDYEELAALGWQAIECGICGGSARGYPQRKEEKNNG
jgi:hypothetical protein